MSSRGGFPVHNGEDPACPCWSCTQRKRTKLIDYQERVRRTSALEAAVDLVVVYVMKDIYELRLGDRVVNGRLREILEDPGAIERPVVEIFLRLPLREQTELLQYARDRKKIRVGDMKFSKDVEAEEAETERKRRGF